VKVGRTSITVNIESWVNRELSEGKRFKVTEGVFTYVKVDENNKPSVI
jgi:acyl-CoA hydrolase